jgi:hypothetical protein
LFAIVSSLLGRRFRVAGYSIRAEPESDHNATGEKGFSSMLRLPESEAFPQHLSSKKGGGMA